MSDELKRLAERYDIPNDALGQLELLMTENLKAENQAYRDRAKDLKWQNEQIYNRMNEALDAVKVLKADNEALKSRIEFYSRSVQVLDEALASAEKVNASKIFRINDLSGRLEQVRTSLGSFSYIVDYPDDDSAETLESMRKDAERYRWLRDSSQSIHPFYLSVPIWFTGVKFAKEGVDSSIDDAMAKEKDIG